TARRWPRSGPGTSSARWPCSPTGPARRRSWPWAQWSYGPSTRPSSTSSSSGCRGWRCPCSRPPRSACSAAITRPRTEPQLGPHPSDGGGHFTMRDRAMADTSPDADRAGLPRVVLPAVLATGLGAVTGVALDLGNALSEVARGALVGGSLGFAPIGAVFVATSAQSVLQLAGRIDELETRDRLTGLPNGRALRAWLEHHLPRANAVQAHTALLVIHADGIGRINESHGREVGDALVKALVARVRSRLRPQDQLFRAGGADVAVVCPEIAGTKAAEELAEALLELVGTPYEVEGELLRVPTCVGLAVGGGRPVSAR